MSDTQKQLQQISNHLAVETLAAASRGATPEKAAPLDTATRGHHPDSPSSLQASAACPGFENEQRESAAATKGTLCHKATETRDLSILDGDESLENAVQKAIEYEEAVLDQFRLAGQFAVVREKYLHVGDDKVKGEGGEWTGVTGGYPDLLVVGHKHGAVVDYKFGAVPVTPTKDNLQGISYVLGAFEAYPEVQDIECHFYAPFQGWSAEEQRRTYVHRFFRRDIPELELRIRTVVATKRETTAAIARNDWTACRPKHDLCIWCKRKGGCPKVGTIISTALSKYHDLEVPAEMKEYRLDTPDRVAQAYRFANQLQTICEAVKKRCIDAAVQDGLLPAGFTIIKSSRREVTDPRKFLELAIDAGLPEEDAVKLISIPITSFEKAIKEKAPKGSGAAKIRAFSAALEESGTTKQGTPFYFLREAKSPAEKANSLSAIDV